MAFLRRFVLYLKEKLSVNQVETENPTTFLAHLQERLAIEGRLLWLCSACLHCATTFLARLQENLNIGGLLFWVWAAL